MARHISVLDEQVLGHQLLGVGGTVPSNSSWGVANKAFYFPVRLRRAMTIKQVWVLTGTTPTGNIDVGVFNGDNWQVGASLALNGAVAQGSASVIQKFNITDIPCYAGQKLFVGISCSSASSQVYAVGTSQLANARGMNCFQQTSAHPLPSTPTPAVIATNVIIPMFALVGRD